MGDTDKTASTEEQGESTEAAQGAEQSKTDDAQGASTVDQGSGGEKPKNPAQEPRLSDENARLRVELKKLRDSEDKREREKRTEAENLAADRQKFEADQTAFAKERQAHAARVAVQSEASKAGFRISSDRVFALVRDGIKFEGDSPTNVREVVAQLASDEPGLIGAANGSPTNPDRSKGGGLTRADIEKMTPDQIAALDSKVLESLSF